MKIELIRSEKPTGFPSASAVEFWNDALYALGDDSLRLYRWSKNVERLPDVLISPEAEPPGERIAKKIKPDFEALTVVSGKLMGMGSCSKGPERETAFLYDGENFEFFSLATFRVAVEGLVKASGARKTNLEGLAECDGTLYIFHRGGKNGENYVFTVPFDELKSGDCMRIGAAPLFLPDLGKGKPGVTGATRLFDDVFMLTAAVEITDDPVADGETLESYLCLWRASQPSPYDILPLTQALNAPRPPKIESVALLDD
ncbi:MAG: hypothetical protein NZ534_11480, partial [Bacteroidia bacterium]|nr:hypothetical protein [Bacteroidia bacterium]